jgi:NADPH:quinone reductase-like Zn-dependent oxidoreductase
VPEVTADTVLVKAQAAALNPVDNALAAGTMAQMIPRQYRWCSAGMLPGPSRR